MAEIRANKMRYDDDSSDDDYRFKFRLESSSFKVEDIKVANEDWAIKFDPSPSKDTDSNIISS